MHCILNKYIVVSLQRLNFWFALTCLYFTCCFKVSSLVLVRTMEVSLLNFSKNTANLSHFRQRNLQFFDKSVLWHRVSAFYGSISNFPCIFTLILKNLVISPTRFGSVHTADPAWTIRLGSVCIRFHYFRVYSL